MSLFQKSIIKKYLLGIDQDSLKKAWIKYTAHFHNPVIQEHIRNTKEEQYQEGFVRDLFVNVLDYTLKPQPNFNFVLEKKTETDATKSDGALLRQDNVIGVVELKDTETTELDKIEKQVFGYKNKHRQCVYVITSNFEKLRFYINDSVDSIDFDLFNLTEQQFAVLYLCLHQKNIEKDLPLKMKQASLAEEENVTKKLYADYSQFKRNLFRSLVQHNSQYDKLELYKKTQKLLDRFLFLLFAEDRLLLPVNSVRGILEEWEKLKELDNYVPLYERFKKFFGYLNTGHDWRNDEIFAYNGGLFASDDLLDNISIDDKILYDGTRQLSSYDFESEVDVNILGHIFEHSLSEIEEVQAELAGNVVEKTKTRRKKDGVFYTPRYITKYIVENTVGALCQQQRQELNIIEEEFIARKFKTSDAEEKRKKKLLATLEAYRSWLFQLTICDPACGSGAFLNQALEFLIAEHRYIDELKAKLFGDLMVLSDVETTILENNLFGVDINEEAIEIARLSLWLRTARKGRKLNDLSRNIKCGNSLIDDPAIARSLAFHWKEQFPQIFEKGGFDVIIGNPPYVDVKNLPAQTTQYLFSNYSTSENRINLYSIFIEKGVGLLKDKGVLSFINPNSMLVNSSYKKLREFLIGSLQQIIKLPDNVFIDAKVETIIIVYQKQLNTDTVEILSYSKGDVISEINTNGLVTVKKESWLKTDSLNFNLYLTSSFNGVISKIEASTAPLVEYCDFSLGITPYDKYKGHTEDQINNRVFHSTEKIDDRYKPLITGENIVRYYTQPHIDEYMNYGVWLGRPREERFFTEERIIARQIVSGNPPRIYASYANEPYYFTHHGFGLIPKPELSVKYLLSILNSKLINFYHTYKYLDIEKRLFQKLLIENCKKLPIKIISNEDQQPFISKTDIMILKTKELYELTRSLSSLLSNKYPTLKLSNKLLDWPTLSLKDFLKELSKKKIKLSLSEEAEWLKYFEEQKVKAAAFQKEIDDTDKLIDQLVYNLYGLTEEEISIIKTS